MNINQIKSIKTFEGQTCFYEHESLATATKMKFSTFIPDTQNGTKISSAIIWLSGLTCNEENFITKAGAQRVLSGTSTMIICPDTSPRGLELPGEHDRYDFGSGAGFYINATVAGYKDHYKMYDYIKEEIVAILKENFQVEGISIMGHSMGGHGALVLGFREPELFKSVSAFSPIVNPTQCPWGQRAFAYYLKDSEDGSQFDVTKIVESGNIRKDTILIEQGMDDQFLEKELLTDNFIKVCEKSKQSVVVNYREGYDHSYYFIASFISEHIEFHLNALKRT